MAAQSGFVVVHPETLPLADQLGLFAGAGCIVGEYGSGLHGSMFAAPGTLVCALRANAIHPGFLQSGLCQVMDQKVGYVFGPAGENDIAQEFTIQETCFEWALRLMDLLGPRGVARATNGVRPGRRRSLANDMRSWSVARLCGRLFGQ